MSETTVAVLALILVGWALVSGLLMRRNVTGPMVFLLAGYLLGNPAWGPLPANVSAEPAQAVAEVTLALLLFTDASRVNLTQLRRDKGLPLRLLGIGLPLTLAAGTGVALLLFTGMPWTLALFIGAALAPTDAALSAQVVNDHRVPSRLRRALNVESGLNDGLAAPVVTLAIVLTALDLGLEIGGERVGLGVALRELLIGAGVGVAMGMAGAVAMNAARRHGWISAGGQRIAVLALSVAAYTLVEVAQGNGFIGVFVAGLAFGSAGARAGLDVGHSVELPELLGELLALVIWFLFGAGLLPLIIDDLSPEIVVYALLSLTVLRMVPVLLALVGSRMPGREIAFLGWFGPRGMASVVFALLAVTMLDEAHEPVVEQAIATIALTVLLSVVAHGVSAGPAAIRLSTDAGEPETSPPGLRSRRSHLG